MQSSSIREEEKGARSSSVCTRENCLLFGTSGSVISERDTKESLCRTAMTPSLQWGGDDGIYIKVASVIGSVSTEGQTTWYRKWFNVTSAKHRRATEAASVFSAVWCLKLKLSSATFLLSFLVSLINLKQSSAPLLCFWTRSTLFRQIPCLHN